MKQQRGFSLIEVVVAMLILTTAILGSQAVSAKMLRLLGTSTVKSGAIQLAEDRIGMIRLDPRYTTLNTYAATESSLTGWPGFTRITTVKAVRDSIAAGVTDYKQISVKVTAPGIPAGVVRSITIGAP
jgi:prepilin-type N-terminal cleavage/methylation domain-containing protein